MKYGEIAKTPSINKRIYDCFRYIREEDERKFMKNFWTQPHDEVQVMHTFNELMLGAFLASKGLTVRYGHKVDGKTPDWCIFDDEDSLLGIVELMNFRTDDKIQRAIEGAAEAGKMLWVHPLPNLNTDRLYYKIGDKCKKYKEIVEKYEIPYVVSVFSHFFAAVKIEELYKCLEGPCGLFRQYPRLSGVLFFEERSGQYHFQYIQNSHPTIGVDLPSDVF